MPTTAKTLIIDRPAGEMVVFVNGDATQRAPIRRTRILAHLGAIYKKLGYTVIDKKRSALPMKLTDQTIYEALTSILTFGDTRKLHGQTVNSLKKRNYITGDSTVTPTGEDFMTVYESKYLPSKTLAARPAAPAIEHSEPEQIETTSIIDPEPAAEVVPVEDNTLDDTADVALTIYTEKVIEVSSTAGPATALSAVREIAFAAVTDILRQRAPEALPYIEIIRAADNTLNGGK